MKSNARLRNDYFYSMRLLLILIVSLLSVSVSAQEITKKRGTVKFYFDDGKLKSKGKVKNYKRRGEWKYYDQQGNVVAIARFVNDSIDGKYLEYYSNGALMYDGNYCMNTKCGEWKTYDDQGRLISVENYKAGQPDGVQRYWHVNNQLRDSIIFRNGELLAGYSWYANGSPRSVSTYKNGMPEGVWIVYRESFTKDTLLRRINEYHSGQLNGWSYEYGDSNQLYRAEHYVNGRFHGDVIRYNSEKQIQSREKYTEGELDSMTLFESGKVAMIEAYTNKGEDGVRTDFYRDGKVMKKLWFHGPVLDSMHAYHANGQLAIRETFRMWRRGFVHEEWDAEGHLLVAGFTDTGDRRDSVWTSYYPNGKVRTITHYQNGAMLGLHTKYYQNGKKMIEMVFLHDGRNTPPDVWNEKGARLRMGTKEYDEIVEGNKPGEIFNDPARFRRSVIERDNPFNHSGKYASSDDVVNGVTIEAAFPGGAKAMDEFIKANLVDPRGPMEDKEGTIYVEYVVGLDGIIGGVRVVKSFTGAGALEQAAVDVVSKFPMHKPIYVNASPARYRMVVPIRFTR